MGKGGGEKRGFEGGWVCCFKERRGRNMIALLLLLLLGNGESGVGLYILL